MQIPLANSYWIFLKVSEAFEAPKCGPKCHHIDTTSNYFAATVFMLLVVLVVVLTLFLY